MNSKAISKLEFMRDAYQKLIDENVDEGRFVGTDVTGTWKADTPLNKVYAEHVEALNLAISALKMQEQERWRPCNEKPEYDFQNVLVRWRDKRKGCEKDYYIFEGYVVRGIWCGLFEDADISDFEPIEWKPLEPYTEEKYENYIQEFMSDDY